MAIVLPIHSHIDFSNPMDNDYESRCQKEETEEENESSTRMFTNQQSENENSNNKYSFSSCRSDDKEDNVDADDEKNNFMDTGNNSDDCDEKTETLPLSLLSEQTDVGSCSIDIDDSTANDCNPSREEEIPTKISAEIYCLMEDENRVGSKPESGNPEEENSAFISSLLVADLASPNNDKNNDETNDPIVDPVSNIVEAILMDETNDKMEDEMKFNLDGTQTATHQATIMDESNDPTTEVDYRDVEFDDESKVEDIFPTAIMEEPVSEAPSYGGLQNLGNTCYMASAIQLLCGLDSFPADLKDSIPPENNDKTKDGDSNSQSLRDILLDVMDRLEKGETVRPNDLKRCIDSRTSLFLGYHQQDSHEFLTTLLDIIDEDYKIKSNPEETAESVTESVDDSSNDDEIESNEESHGPTEMIDYTNSDKDLAVDTNHTEHPLAVNENAMKNTEQECNDDENNCECNSDDDDDGSDRKSLESALKKQKVVELETKSVVTEAIKITARRTMEKSKSYSNFKFSDIQSLLHDKGDTSTKAVATVETAASSAQAKTTSRQDKDEPKCKLAGGRMSTTGVELTRFVDESGIDEDVRPTGVSLEKATAQQQIVEGDNDLELEEEGETEETSLTPISSNFTTKVRVCLTCESCKFRRSHIETYLHLSLDISTGSSENDSSDDVDVCNLGIPSRSSIEEGLRRFFAPEKREIKCEKCFHTSALQTSEITQLPRNLLFHLKRFIVDISPDYSSISYRKDQSSVIFRERMELESHDDESECDNQSSVFRSVHDDEEFGFKDFLAQDCSYEPGAAYEIRSVVNHIGSSASCGHYTADAKRQTLEGSSSSSSGKIEIEIHEQQDDESENTSAQEEEPIAEDREWIRFNDSYVSKISSKEAVEDASKTAYMIMYELVQ